MKSVRVIILLLCASTCAFARNAEFQGIVRSIEQTYGVRHTHIPFFGLAAFLARPAGVRGLKLAVFEDFRPPADTDDFRRVIENSLGPDWHPFIRVESKRETQGETTLIYMNPSGGQMRMMIVNIEPSEAMILHVNLSEHAIEKWLKEPGEQVSHNHHLHYTED